MIDILTVVYRNYELLELQREHWRTNIRGEHRLLVLDNTPLVWRQECAADLVVDLYGSDGQTHGMALDALVRASSSDIVGIVDTDFFWVVPDIIAIAQDLFAGGVVCFGAGGFYPDFQTVIDRMYPHRAGARAPVCWGMFVKRDLALEHSFVVTPEERSETGWRLRETLVRGDLCRVTLPGWPDPSDPELYWFGPDQTRPYGFHLLKGSGGRMVVTHRVPALIHQGLTQWALA